MNRTMVLSSWVLGGILFPVLVAAEPIPLTSEAARGGVDAPDLRPGVVVDPSRRAIYLMTPDGGIDAVSSASGELIWSTAEAAKPLALYGDVLIAQGPPTERGGVLDIVLLDSREGELRQTLPLKLPEGVWASVDEGMDRSFTARADLLESAPVVSWEHIRRHVQGTALRPGEKPVELKSGGAYRLDLESGRAVALKEPPKTKAVTRPLPAAVQHWVDTGKPSRAPAPAGEVLAATQVVSGTGPTRIVLKRWRRGSAEVLPDVELFVGDYALEFRSADSRHLSVVERVAPGEWDQYAWSVFSLETGQRLGQFRASQSYAWFVVDGSTLIYIAQSYGRRIGDDWVEVPRKLRAVLLDRDQVVWERPLRDPTYRGPFPP